MRSSDTLTQVETVDLLNRCWMTHDGMWFFHCVGELGIERANKLNKAAIRSLAGIEIDRMLASLGAERRDIATFAGFREFFIQVSRLFIPEFMNFTWGFGDNGTISWEFNEKKCFAYKGVKRIGVLEKYECGVIYRVQCWLDALGVGYSIDPPVTGCLMRGGGPCAGTMTLRFPGREGVS